MIDEERHDPGIPVLGRIGNDSEAADHLAAHHVVELAARRSRSLLGQDLEVVPMERRARSAGSVALGGRVGYELAQRALLFSGPARPIEAVLLAGPADDALCV